MHFDLQFVISGDSYQARILRDENEYLRKQLAQAEWSMQQMRGTEEQTLSGSEDEEEESDDGVWIILSVFLFVAGQWTGFTTASYVCMCLYHQV